MFQNMFPGSSSPNSLSRLSSPPRSVKNQIILWAVAQFIKLSFSWSCFKFYLGIAKDPNSMTLFYFAFCIFDIFMFDPGNSFLSNLWLFCSLKGIEKYFENPYSVCNRAVAIHEHNVSLLLMLSCDFPKVAHVKEVIMFSRNSQKFKAFIIFVSAQNVAVALIRETDRMLSM